MNFKKLNDMGKIIQYPVNYPVNVSPTHFSNFSEITRNGSITKFFKLELSEPYFKRRLFKRPKTLDEKELILYFEGANQSIESAELESHLVKEGNKIIEDPHPSLLINAMGILTNKTLTKLGIPWFTSILLPTKIKDYMVISDGTHCIFSIQRGGYGNRDFKLHAADIIFKNSCAFLVEKI